ncbi:M3 family oligoendopeptidase [Treponema sp.]|uniref:M3 family oligoendopeptidase n=1 Tax=Treponema sp. TaxID=166 RepID=UPI00388CFAF7
MENTIPRWNLNSIFSSITSKEYKNALADFSNGMEYLEQLLETARNSINLNDKKFDFSDWLKTFLDSDEKVTSLCTTLNAYAYIIYSVDTTNTEYLNNITKIDNLTLRYRQIDLSFKSVLLSALSINPDKLEDFYKKFPEYTDYRYILNEIIEETKHQMSPQEENLAGELQQTGGNAWDRLHEQLISNLTDSESGKTFNELRNDAYSSDADTRKSSYLKEIALLKQNEIAFAACLNNLKGETITLNRRRKWQQPLDRSLFSSRLSQKTLDSLISAIEESLPIWREYFQIKAEYLHKKGLTVSEDKKGLAFYDLFAPLAQTDKTWTFKEAQDYIIERYNSFSSDMGSFAKKAFAENWIDAQVRSGKVGGAYDEDFPLGHQSRIMTNFTGTFSDIITLAHELGHAYHFSCMKGKRTAFFSYPMTLAETASTFAETIVKQDMISKNYSESETIQILDIDLQDVSQVLVDILCRFYFEKTVFDEREKTELTAEDFCRLMKNAQEKSYGNGLNTERHEYMWAVKSHYYSTGLDFYNFPYAFGQLFASGLYALYQKEGESFAKTYAELLSNTGNLTCEDLCARAGFDITTKAFWKSGIEMYKKEIDLLKKLLINKN